MRSASLFKTFQNVLSDVYSMRADTRFLNQPKKFWAYVRTISQEVGYTTRKTKTSPAQVKIPTVQEVKKTFEKLNLDCGSIIQDKDFVGIGRDLHEYFAYRADKLNNYVEPRLMDKNRAKEVYEQLKSELNPTCDQPMNKQKGDKKAPAYLTCIINMLVQANIDDAKCNYDPRELTTVTKDNEPLGTLARRVDGAYPSVVNPLAIWEIKEYYYTTTFGSRVADGVYETLLDGMELAELRENEGINVKHYLMIDDRFTWWDCGRPYLCRIIDMLHMGYANEVLFGYEVVERLPEIARSWGSNG